MMPPGLIDNDFSRIRPKNAALDRERLFDDAIKQKIAANYLKDENLRLKTKVHILEGEIQKKEKFIDEIIQQQDSYQIGGVGGPVVVANNKSTQPRNSTHLTLNLKRKIRELQSEVATKQDEIELLKKNVRTTRLTEMEVENKMFMDECTRLRHQLEEVIKTKDTFADPEEMKIIEAKFQQQDLLINQLRQDNTQLALLYQQRDGEAGQLREAVGQYEQKQRQVKQGQSKELLKVKKQLNDKQRELRGTKDQLTAMKILSEDLKARLEEQSKKTGSFVASKPQQQSYLSSNANSQPNHSSVAANDREV